MKTILRVLTFIIFSILLVSCAAKLKVIESKAIPNVVAAGDEVKFMVKVGGPADKIGSVTGTVREYPDFELELNDSGMEGDEKAGDGIWTYQVNIPMNAGSGKYHLEIEVKNKSGETLVSKEFEGQSFGKSGVIEITVN